mmetsp:Transcript_29258/g.85796  ORF Transcript_29258/g.85796 Transcript_29258/m.85796 type:complete len:427 (+) Transcript_29258:25-1305(+)
MVTQPQDAALVRVNAWRQMVSLDAKHAFGDSGCEEAAGPDPVELEEDVKAHKSDASLRYGRWFGQISMGGSVQDLNNRHYSGIQKALVFQWLQLLHQSREDDVSLLAFAKALATAVASEPKAALPLTLSLTLRRDRLRLGPEVQGSRCGSHVLQLLPVYTRDTLPWLFLRSIVGWARRQAWACIARPELEGVERLLFRLGVTRTLSEIQLTRLAKALTACVEDEMPAPFSNLSGSVRGWCQWAAYLYTSMTMLRCSIAARAPSSMLAHVEWLVYLPGLFESVVRVQLGKKLAEHQLHVFKPNNAAYRLPHFERRAYPDIVVRDERTDKAIAVYDVKLYRRAEARRDHMNQVEAYCLVLGAGIVHAGLIYGFWDNLEDDASAPEPQEAPADAKNCYFVRLSGECENVLRQLDEVLSQVVTNLSARGR